MTYNKDMSPWEIMGVPEGTDMSVVRGRFRKLMRETHPDATGVEDVSDFLLVNDAYRALKAMPADPDVVDNSAFTEPVVPIGGPMAAAARRAAAAGAGRMRPAEHRVTGPDLYETCADGPSDDDLDLFGDTSPVGGPSAGNDDTDITDANFDDGEDDDDSDDEWLDGFYSNTPAQQAAKGRGKSRAERSTDPELSPPTGKVRGSRRTVGTADVPGDKGSFDSGKRRQEPPRIAEDKVEPGSVSVANGRRQRNPSSHRAEPAHPTSDLDSLNEHHRPRPPNFGATKRQSSLDDARRSAISGSDSYDSPDHPGRLAAGAPMILVAFAGIGTRLQAQDRLGFMIDAPAVAVAVAVIAAAALGLAAANRVSSRQSVSVAIATGFVVAVALIEMVAMAAVPLLIGSAVVYAWTRNRSVSEPGPSRELTR